VLASSTATATVSSITSGPYGPAILGYAHPEVVGAVSEQAQGGFGCGAPTKLEVQLAELLSATVKVAQRVRLVSSGTEAGARLPASRFEECQQSEGGDLRLPASSSRSLRPRKAAIWSKLLRFGKKFCEHSAVSI
jgi:hypothetical protein